MIMKWNGTKIPTPTSFIWTRNDIASSGSGRSTVTGQATKIILTTKIRIDCTWVLNAEEQKNLLQSIKANTFGTLEYFDSYEGAYVTKIFYTDDIKSDAFYFDENTSMWHTSFAFIEK